MARKKKSALQSLASWNITTIPRGYIYGAIAIVLALIAGWYTYLNYKNNQTIYTNPARRIITKVKTKTKVSMENGTAKVAPDGTVDLAGRFKFEHSLSSIEDDSSKPLLNESKISLKLVGGVMILTDLPPQIIQYRAYVGLQVEFKLF